MKQPSLVSYLWHLLTPPAFEDAELARRALTQHRFLLITLFVTFILALILLRNSPIPGVVLAIFGLIDLFAILGLATLRRGRLKLSAAIFLSAIWGSVNALAGDMDQRHPNKEN